MLDDLLVNEDPDNRCFGCSPHNEKGLALRFVRREPGVVEFEDTAEPVIVRGRWLRSEGKDHFAKGEILDPRGRRATVAESRWRAIDAPLPK